LFVEFCALYRIVLGNHATGYARQHIWYLSQARIAGGLRLGLSRVPRYPSGIQVINYPSNFLLPDGYPVVDI